MNKKAFIMSWYVDFYAYLLFILLIVIFYFFFIKGAHEPLTIQVSQQKDVLDKKFVELYVLRQTYLGFSIQELLHVQDEERLSTIVPYLQTLVPPHKMGCAYSVEYKFKDALRLTGKDQFARKCYDFYTTRGITLPTKNQQDIVYTLQCPGGSCS